MENNGPPVTPSSLKKRVTDLGLARGTVTDALITAAVRGVLFIVVPLLLIFLLLSGPNKEQVISGWQEVRTNVLIFGAILVVISFAWAYHLRSTKARLIFGLIGAGLLVVYGFAVFLTGGFNDAISGLGWKLPGYLLFGVVCYIALGSALKFIRDYQFFRKLRTRSKEEVAYKPKLGLGEFDWRLGSISSAASLANKVVRRTIVRWSIILILLTFLLSLTGFGSNPAESGYLDILSNMAAIVLLMGIPIVIMTWFMGFYPKGTVSMTVADVGRSLSIVFLIFLIFVQSGLTEAANTSEVNFPFLPIVLALVLWAVIDVLRAIGEYGDERRPWKMRVGYEVKKKKSYRVLRPDSPLLEFSLGIGKTSRGLVSAQKTFFRFVTLVVILVVLALGAAQAAGLDTGPMFLAMKDVVYLVPWLGLLLTLISFGRGFYPAGSLGRLFVGLLLVPGLFFYIFSTFLTPAVQQAARSAGLIIPFNLVVVLVVVSILFVGFLQVTEFIDARRAWLQSVGKKIKPLTPITKMTRLQEFRYRFGSSSEMTAWARKGMIRYLYYTTIILIVVLTIIESTSFSIGGISLSRLDANLRQMYITIVLLAIPLAAVRAMYGFYPAGSTSKLAFGMLVVLVGASYTYLGLQGGQLVREGDFGTVSAGLSIDFSFVVNAFLIGWALYASTILVEYLVYRKEWIANDYRPVASKEVQAQIKEQKLIEKEERRVKRAEKEGISLSELDDREAVDSEAEVEAEIKQEIGEEALQVSKTTKKR
jgi:MFS family permease